MWRQDLTRAAPPPRCKRTKTALAWALEELVVARLSRSRIAQALGVAWGTASTAVLDEGYRRLISDHTRFDGVAIIIDRHRALLTDRQKACLADVLADQRHAAVEST